VDPSSAFPPNGTTLASGQMIASEITARIALLSM